MAIDNAADSEQYTRLRRATDWPLGEGDVDFPKYVALLKSTGFNGYYVIEREVGDNPAADIAKAKRFLDALEACCFRCFQKRARTLTR